MSRGTDLVIFHYHLSAGGVGSVIRHALSAIADHGRTVRRVRVVTGVPPDPPLGQDTPAESVVIPEVGYREPPRGAGFRDAALRLAVELRRRFSSPSEVWWIHNHHLGKNPVFTQAILDIAASRDPPRMILQPHDFPEAGRYALLRSLERLTRSPYPTGPHIRWALINTRDRRMLSEAGIADSSLFLLHDPVPEGRAASRERRRAADGLRARLFPGGDPSAPILLSPVRAIRRKNVLETALISLLLRRGARLIVTLPGTSDAERRYSRLVEGLFDAGAVSGLFGAGVRRPEITLDELAGVSDLAVSGSIQEGFGYIFAQAAQWGLPLCARRLDVLADVQDLFSGPGLLYDALLCPLERRERRGLERRYGRKLRFLSDLIPGDAVRSMADELSTVFGRDMVDFSLLDPARQAALVVQAARSPDLAAAIAGANQETVAGVRRLLDAPDARPIALPGRYGLPAFMEGLEGILASFDAPAPEADSDAVRAGVRRAFARLEYLRLLYD